MSSGSGVTGILNLQNAATATTNAGTVNVGDAFYEQGFNVEYPDTGLPLRGSTVASINQPNDTYRFASSYTGTNDAVLVNSVVTSATIIFLTPAPYSALSFMGCSGSGTCVINCIVHHADGTSEAGAFTFPDWFGGATTNQILTANGE